MADGDLLLLRDERTLRIGVAGAATVIAVGTLLTRSDAVVSWSLLAPTVAIIWFSAIVPSAPRWPAYVMAIVIPFVLNIIEADEEVSMFLLILAIALLAATEPRRQLVTTVVLVTAFMIVTLSLTGAMSDVGWQNWLFGAAFTWGFGEMLFRYHQTITELQATRALIADQAASRERRRIARDVHDLVGHSLSVVMLHLTGARHLVRKDPAEAERALEQAEAAGRESLAEIRRTVGLLRDDQELDSAVNPSPDLTDVSLLVDEFLIAGIEIDLRINGEIERVDRAPSLAGYRIIQEALTNVSRHTNGSEVSVSITVDPSTFDVAIRNAGGAIVADTQGAGFGLISMRERAKSVGGSLVAGPTPSGWTVEATLPNVAVGVSP